jgi:hypothetical protein
MTQTTTIGRPAETEYMPYYGKYVSLVPGGEILAILDQQSKETLAQLRAIPEERGTFRYAPDKWSIKELLGHLIDSEIIFAYRALRFARNDRTPLPGFEQDDYVRAGGFDARPLSGLIEELEMVRRATVLLFKHLPEEAWLRTGLANDSEVSVRALAYIIAGHERHHLNVLREKYL